MSNQLLLSALIALTLLLPLSGCQSETTPTNLEIKPAPIHEINISYAKSNPPQVLVSIKGGLPDGCSKFHDVNFQVTGKTVDIKVTIERPKDAICTAIYGYFDQTINLGSNFVRGDVYTVNVNDQTTTFTMQ
jgi:hypothetical protein